jgi:hypothetical protein
LHGRGWQGLNMNRNENLDFNTGKNSKEAGKDREDLPLPNEIHILRNSEEFFEATSAPKQVRTKLTREELLAGYAVIEESRQFPQAPIDPRFKSPDDFLLHAASRKTAPEPIVIKTDELSVIKKDVNPAASEPQYGMPDLATLRQELELERKNLNRAEPALQEKPVLEAKKPTIKIEPSNPLPGFGTATFENVRPREEIVSEELKHQHANEIRQWKEYAAGVKAWQGQVMEIVDKMKIQLRRAKEAEHENEALKDLVRRKESELRASQQKPKIRILDWMKSFRKVTA